MTELAAASAGQGALRPLAEAEAQLEALRKELDHTHQLATLGTLTAGIAHEVNNILTPVLAYAQLAKANPSDADLQAKALERAIAGVESASRIIEAVLGFARADDRGSTANVAGVIEAALACLGREPQRDGIALRLNVPADLEVRIRPLALQQVLLNLILNAVTAMRGKPGELHISTGPAGADLTRITISDTGPGVPNDMRQTIFEPFVTTAQGRVGQSEGCHGGSGLGLTICKRLIEEAGGTITLEPQQGRGTIFSLTLSTFHPDQNDSNCSKNAA